MPKIYKLSLALGLLPLLGFADTCCPLIPGDPIEENQVCPGYFYPALYDVGSCLDISVSGDFIYWNASKQLNAIAFEETVIPGVSAHTDVIIHRFGYRPGFKVGIGLGLPGFDHFSFNAEYLSYDHTTTKTHTAGPGQFLTTLAGIVPFPLPQPIATHVESKWHFELNTVQLTFSRPFYLGTRLILDPAFGLKAFWYDEKQSIDFDLITGAVGTQRGHFKSWALGPYVNIKAKGLLWCGTYLLAKFGFLVPYQKHTKDLFQADFPFVGKDQIDFDFDKKKPYAFEPYLESGLGLGWGHYFCDCSWHADMAVTYDYFGALFHFLANIGGPMAKDHWMHGLTVRAQFDF